MDTPGSEEEGMWGYAQEMLDKVLGHKDYTCLRNPRTEMLVQTWLPHEQARGHRVFNPHPSFSAVMDSYWYS